MTFNFCPLCGHDIKGVPTAHYCPNCGADLMRVKPKRQANGAAVSKLPDSIAEEYESGMGLMEIAGRYHSYAEAVRKRLTELGVTMRKQGWASSGKGNAKRKVNAKQVADILLRDTQGEPHPRIAKDYNISRERVRQICLEHQHAPRAAIRTGQAAERVLAYRSGVEARKAERADKWNEASRLWIEGAESKLIQAALGVTTAPRMHQKICYLRKRHPEMFPHRQENHWKLAK